MVDKSGDGRKAEDNVFRVTVAGETTSPEFLKAEKDYPAEPERHLKNLEQSAAPPSNSMVEVNLDDEHTTHSGSVSEAGGTKPADQAKPKPVDLTPVEETSPTVREKTPPPQQPAGPPPHQSPLPTAEQKQPELPDKPKIDLAPAAASAASTHDLRMAAQPPTEDSLSKTPDGPPPDTDPIATGWAISDGKTLYFPGGARFTSGDVIQCNDRRYRVKLQTGYPPEFYMKAVGLFLLVLLAAIGISSFFGGSPAGTIAGVVIDGGTGMVIPDALVTLPNGTATTTSIAGLFSFAGLDPGEYKATASMPGYTPVTLTAVQSENDNISLAFVLEPLFVVADKEIERTPEPEQTQESKQKVDYGALKLDIEFDDYIIYLDGKIFGKDIKSIKKIQPGEHDLTLEKSQFEEYRTTATIKARRTTTVKITLDHLKRKTTPRQRAKERFAEGRTALDSDYHQAAIEAFDAALAEVSDYPEALQYRGWAYRKLGNAENAAQDFKAAAELYALGNRYLDAITCANLLLEIHPKGGAYYLMRGNYNTALGELKTAIEDYKEAVNMDDRSLRFRLALAEGYYRDRQFKEAAKEFEKARKMTDNPADIYVRLILSYMYAGKDKDLVKRYHELADIAPAEKMETLRRDPEWQSVLQLVGPDEKHKER